jgi:hypothetical protein
MLVERTSVASSIIISQKVEIVVEIPALDGTLVAISQNIKTIIDTPVLGAKYLFNVPVLDVRQYIAVLMVRKVAIFRRKTRDRV